MQLAVPSVSTSSSTLITTLGKNICAICYILSIVNLFCQRNKHILDSFNKINRLPCKAYTSSIRQFRATHINMISLIRTIVLCTCAS